MFPTRFLSPRAVHLRLPSHGVSADKEKEQDEEGEHWNLSKARANVGTYLAVQCIGVGRSRKISSGMRMGYMVNLESNFPIFKH